MLSMFAKPRVFKALIMENKDLNYLAYSEKIDDGEKLQYWHRFNFDFIKDRIKDKKILDIGCWTGGLEYYLNDFSCEPYAIDIDERALSIARLKFPQIKFQVGNAWSIPFADGYFDVVALSFVLEHIKDAKELKTLAEINRVLKPGGIFLLCVPAGNIISRLVDPAYFLGRHRHYNKRRLKKILSSAGFEIVKLAYRGGWYNTSKMLLFYFYKFVLRRQLPELKWLEQKIAAEFQHPGYDGVFLIAKKHE